MKLISFFLCSLSLSLTARAEPPPKSGDSAPATISLGAITDGVLAHNPAIREARARWEAMKQRVPQAAAWDDLKVSGGSRIGRFVDIPRNSFADETFSVEQMIPLSGRNRSRERIAAADALAALQEARRTELDVVAKARAAYFRLSRDYALLALNRANEASLVQTVEINRARLEVGSQGQADLLLAENEASELEEARHDLLQSVSDDETQLNALMGRDPFAALGKPSPSPPFVHETFSVEPLRAAALNCRPEARRAEAAVAAAKAKLELARREWIPDPTVSVETLRYNGAAQIASEVSGGISFNVPWLNGRKYRAEEREAMSGVEAAQQALESARTEALGLLRDQLQKIETFHHHVELFETRLIPNARQALQIDRTGYEGGKTGFLELMSADRSLRELEAMLQQHLAGYRTAVAELEAIIGTDLDQLWPCQETSKGKSK